MKKFANLFKLLLILSCNPCLAQLENCNGTWTNKPCNQLNKASEKKTKVEDKEKSKKDSLIHDLRMLSIKAKREHDIRYDISVTEEHCKKSSLEQCDLEIKRTQKDLQALITQAQVVKTKEEQNELIKESNKINKERNEIEAKKPGVIIQQNTILVPRRRPPIWDQTFKGASSSGQNSSLPTNAVSPE